MNTLSIDDCVAQGTLFDLLEDEMRLFHVYAALMASDAYTTKERARFRSCELSHWKRVQMLKAGIEKFEAIPPDEPSLIVFLQVWFISLVACIKQSFANCTLKQWELDLLGHYQSYWRLNDSCGKKWKRELLMEQNQTYELVYASLRDKNIPLRREVIVSEEAKPVAFRQVQREC